MIATTPDATTPDARAGGEVLEEDSDENDDVAVYFLYDECPFVFGLAESLVTCLL